MDQIANVIAALGVYFALMAVLAVFVEAVISWLKIPFPRFQSKPSPDDVLKEVQGWLPDKDKHLPARITALNKSLKAIGDIELLGSDADLEKIAETIGEATTRHLQDERKRRGFIRLLAIVVGIGFAFLFQIDTLELLTPLAGPAQETWKNALGEGRMHIAGIVLSGFAASAGSSFWHDKSSRLRKLDVVTESIAELQTKPSR